MTDTAKLFNLAQLAEATYANLLPGLSVEAELKNANFNMNFSPIQAAEFVKNWQVVNHQPNTTSGYLGTLFKYIGNDPNSGFSNGEYVLSLRGTEGLFSDDLWQEDIGNIVTDGLAHTQIVDMYNHWQQMVNPANDAHYQRNHSIRLSA